MAMKEKENLKKQPTFTALRYNYLKPCLNEPQPPVERSVTLVSSIVVVASC